MRNSVHAMLVACMAIAAPAPAAAWDYPGHRIVGAIADWVLKLHYEETTYQRVREQLTKKDDAGHVVERRTLSQVAVFPDCAKRDNEPYCGRPSSEEERDYAERNPQHNTYHYTDVPIQQPKYVAFSAGTEETDVVQMMRYAIAVLRDKKPPDRRNVKLTKTEAVWLLAHLVGDIHQPLHVGGIYFDKKTCKTIVDPNQVPGGMANVASTNGGNYVMLLSPAGAPAVGPADNLHFFWDGAAVVRAMRAAGLTGEEQEFARVLAAKAPSDWQTPGEPETWAEQWVAEIMPIAELAHTKLEFELRERKEPEPGRVSCKWNAKIPPDYPDWAAQEAAKQLTKAGFRLAALLVAIFPK